MDSGQISSRTENTSFWAPKMNAEVSGNTIFISGKSRLVKYKLGGGFKYFLFSSLPGEMIHFD